MQYILIVNTLLLNVFNCLNIIPKVYYMSLTWMVYLHTPRVFHSLMVLSLDPDTICLLSALNATLRTSLVCPTNWRVVVPLKQEKCLTSKHVVWQYRSTIQRHLRAEIPETESFIPWSGESKLSIRWHDHIRDEVTVSLKSFLGDSVVSFITSQIPHNQRLVWKKEKLSIVILSQWNHRVFKNYIFTNCSHHKNNEWNVNLSY